MTNSPPIVPSETELRHWSTVIFDEDKDPDVVLTQAFQAGADQELEACCEWFANEGYGTAPDRLRAARRPKPLSRKERALNALSHLIGGAAYSMDTMEFAEYIRQALEQLPDD